MMKPCPHCGAPIHEEASFCPHCAQAVNQRRVVHAPRHMPRRALYSALLVFAAAALLLLLGQQIHSRPQVYDNGGAEVIYPAQRGGSRLCFASAEAPSLVIPQNHHHGEQEYSYRYPIQLYVTDETSGELITEDFMREVQSITAEFNSSDAYLSVTRTEPQARPEIFPNAAAVIFVDYSILGPGDHIAELICTVTMRNGDIIRLHQEQQYSSINTYKFTAQDTPMNTIQELQSLVDGIADTVDEWDQVYLYLPPVVYDGGLILRDRTIHLNGSVGSDGQRTTFTGTIQASYPVGVHNFDGVNVLGPGEGVGVRVVGSARVHLNNCRISGWETGYAALEHAWINVDKSVFEDNIVGLRFNSVDSLVSDDFYVDNIFQNNGTAVLLERVAGDISLKFPGSLFTGNDTDIDNRCGQKLELEGAVFR